MIQRHATMARPRNASMAIRRAVFEVTPAATAVVGDRLDRQCGFRHDLSHLRSASGRPSVNPALARNIR